MKLFKKAFSVFLAVLAVAVLSVPAFAASGINKNEQKVIDLVAGGSKISGNYYAPLQSYQNTMRNYFNRDGVNVTAAEADGICSYIKKIYDQGYKYSTTAPTVNLKILPYAWRKEILQAGIDAAKVIDLILVYNKSNNHVVISTQEGEVLFDQEPIITIKKTGSDYTVTYVCVGIAGAVAVAGVATAVIVLKKRKLSEV